jgi:hypothetical protein
MSKDLGAFLIGAVYLSALFVLVRPGSQGPQLVSTITGGVGNVLQDATGGGTWASA